MNAIDLIKLQTEQAFGLVKMSAVGLDDAQYNYAPPGTCNPAAKTHVHALTAFDFFVLGKAKGGETLWPSLGPTYGLPADPLGIWGMTEPIDVNAIMDFGERVKKATLDYIATLTEADLEAQIDTEYFGVQARGFVLLTPVLHGAGHAGEVAAIKGMQGLKGLPF